MHTRSALNSAVNNCFSSFDTYRNVQRQTSVKLYNASDRGWKKNKSEDLLIKHTDSDLLTLVGKSQDRQAFSLLFNRLAPRLKNYIMKLGATPEAADEVVQETFVKIWRKAEQFYQKKASASTWIFTIARNLRVDRIRKEIRPTLDPNEPLLRPDEEPSPLQVLERSAVTEQVRKSIEKLSSDQQQVIKLSFIEGLSHQEISTQLKLPLGTVKSRLRLSFEKLRLQLGKLR